MVKAKWLVVAGAACVALAAVTALVCVAATSPAPQVVRAQQVKLVDPLGVKDAKQFFRWYLGMKEKMQTKGEFETIAAFQKRMPPPFNSQKTIYFSIQRDPTAKEYTYDSASKVLRLTAGQWDLRSNVSFSLERVNSPIDDKWPHRLVVRMDESSNGQYVGENAFGTTMVVTRNTTVSYALSLVNGDTCGMLATSDSPKLDEGFGRQISVDLTLDPKEAKRLSQMYEIVVGVRLVGYSHSEIRGDYRAATLDAPSDSTYDLYVIGASLREVLVRDRLTRTVLKRLSIESTNDN